MVRQEGRSRQDQKPAGLERNSGGAQPPHRRDQVAADPAARPGSIDGWIGCDRESVVAGIARLLNINCHCEERSDEAIQLQDKPHDGLLRGACHRARIRATRWLAMTAREFRFEFQTADTRPHSRGGRRPRLAFRVPQTGGSRECRMRAAPAVSRARGKRKTHTSIQVQRRHSDIPCAMALGLTSRSPRRIGLCCLRRLTEFGTLARSGSRTSARLDANH